ncbi:translation elongation factor Ts [bacterium]|nr:translation elongation factor Ts [bacterium]
MKAAKKQGAIAADGVVMAYGKNDHCMALIEVNSQTDFVAKNENFLNCVNTLLDLILENKPEGIDALLALTYPGANVPVSEELNQLTAKLGEKISVRRFAIMQAEGTDFVAGYTHANKRVAAIATFRGQNDPEVVKAVMMNIVANNPQAIDKNGVDKA